MATTLDEGYEFLETKAIEENYSHNICDIFKGIREDYIKNNQEEEAKKAQYEIDILNFNINENELSFMFAGTNEKGEQVQYPTLKLFTEETYQYLYNRQKNSINPLIKSRYSHILWLSPKKKIEFAVSAIDEYLKLIRIREKQEQENPNEHFGLKVLDNIKNAFLLSVSIKSKTDETKKEILRIVKKYSLESSSANAIRFQLINLMLKHKLIFKASDFKGIISVCTKHLKKIYETNNKHKAIDMLELMIKIEKKLDNKTIDLETKIAELWEELSYDREDGTNIVSSEFCKNAIKQYKKVKHTKKVKELEKRFNVLRKNIKLGKFGEKLI